MCVDLLNLSYKQKNISLAEQAVLSRLAWHADSSGKAFPSIASLTSDIKADRKTVQKCLISLIKKNLIFRTGEMKGRTKLIHVYKLTLNDPKIGTVKKSNDPVFSNNDPKNGIVKRSQKRDMERSFNKDQRKDVFLNSSGPKSLKNIIENLNKS